MKLPRLQLHLSTCIVLMFVAGGFVGLNLKSQPAIIVDKAGIREFEIGVNYGWPSTVCSDSYLFERFAHQVPSNPDPSQNSRNWHLANLAINIATALALLAAVAIASEFMIRRRGRAR